MATRPSAPALKKADGDEAPPVAGGDGELEPLEPLELAEAEREGVFTVEMAVELRPTDDAPVPEGMTGAGVS